MPAAYGGADHVIGITFNMTSQKEAEFASQETRESLAGTRYPSSGAHEGRRRFCSGTSVLAGRVSDSPEWRAWTGQDIGQIQDWGWLNALHPADRERIHETVQRIMDTRLVSSYEYRVRDRTGEYHWFRSSIAPVLNEEGTPVEWVGAAQRIADPGREPEGTFVVPPQGVLPPHANGPLTSWQVRAARGILGWSVRELAEKAGVSVSTIRRVRERTEPRWSDSVAIRGTLERAGIGLSRGPWRGGHDHADEEQTLLSWLTPRIQYPVFRPIFALKDLAWLELNRKQLNPRSPRLIPSGNACSCPACHHSRQSNERSLPADAPCPLARAQDDILVGDGNQSAMKVG